MASRVSHDKSSLFVLVFEIVMNIKRQSKHEAFTLVELMGAVVISMIVILLLYKIFDTVQSVFVVGQNRSRVMEQGRIAMDMMVKDFKALSPALPSEVPAGTKAMQCHAGFGGIDPKSGEYFCFGGSISLEIVGDCRLRRVLV